MFSEEEGAGDFFFFFFCIVALSARALTYSFLLFFFFERQRRVLMKYTWCLMAEGLCRPQGCDCKSLQSVQNLIKSVGTAPSLPDAARKV